MRIKKAADPRVAFLSVFLLSTASVVLRHPLALLPVLLCAVAGAVWARAPVGQVLRRLRGLWALLLSVALLQTLFHGSWRAGLLVGTAVLERLFILMLSGALLANYPGHLLVQGMLQLRLPYQLAYMVSVGLRFLPLFRESYRDSLLAIQLRGVDFHTLKWRMRFRVYTYLMMPTLVTGILSARTLSMAMELRGFGACETRSAYAPLRMARRDWVLLAAALALAAALLAGEVALHILLAGKGVS
jgi:energy-coupling factor transport system permease protein